MPDIGIVVKRCGNDIVGGAESMAVQLSQRLTHRGYAVEILTTCIRDNEDWSDFYPSGSDRVEGISVRRFPIWQGRNAQRYQELSYRIGNRLTHSECETYQWLHEGLHSAELYQHLQQHGRAYRLIVVLDYSVSLSLYALHANTGRTMVWPLLHNEPFAYIPAVRHWLNSAEGIIFNVAPEMDFARFELGIHNPDTAIVGVGVETTLLGQPDRFRRKFSLDEPFLLYVGRLDAGKNLATLIGCFLQYKQLRDTELKLVLVGDGPFAVLDHPDILELGPLFGEEKYDAYAAALVLCQPSLMESLSIVVLESLAQGTPVLVHGANDVTRYHCRTGDCGLYFYTYDDFALTLKYLQEHPGTCQILGENGRKYVLENYNWETVTERLVAALHSFGLQHG